MPETESGISFWADDFELKTAAINIEEEPMHTSLLVATKFGKHVTCQ